MRIGLLWWGSLSHDGATLGDLDALLAVSEALSERGCAHTVITETNWREINAPTVQIRECAEREFDVLAFICGPLIWHPVLNEWLADRRSSRRVAIGVSMISGQSAMWPLFDDILPRDGRSDETFDLALSRFRHSEPVQASLDGPTMLCLRGPSQWEYGSEKPLLASEAQRFLENFAGKLERPVEVFDTVLMKPGDEDRVRNDFQRAGYILTTRMHGALYSLLYGHPCLAIDQVTGGAKVANVLSRCGWPFVFRADLLNEQVDADPKDFAGSLETINKSRAQAIQASSDALEKAIHMIVGD